MEWEAPAVVLDARPFGEANAIATVLTSEHGACRGMVHGARSKAKSGTWLAGNLVRARWTARLADQLGTLSAELAHPAAALAMDDALTLAMLSSACATVEGCLVEREPHPHVFNGLVSLIAHLARGRGALAELVLWEAALLSDLGYGLDLSACAVTGDSGNLAFVSPRTGRAVSLEAAGPWKERLLPLPAFMTAHAREGENAAEEMSEIADGLRLTGHFLTRDAFGQHHRPLPAARIALYERVHDLAHEDSKHHG